jgi:hypothetical protein
MNKPRLVRFWLLCLAAVVLACAYPEWAICLPPLLFFPGQAGCFCCAGGCTGCNVGTQPGSYQVVIAGVTDDACGDCEQLNDTFVVTFTGQSGSSNQCTYEYIFDPDICTYTQIWLFIFNEFPSGMVAECYAADTNPLETSETENVKFRTVRGGASTDCQFSALDFSIKSRIGNDCTNSSATCTVTAL